MHYNYLETHPTNFNDKEYFRVFNDSSFELGGKFYGSWWISPSKDIRKHITLDDEKTVELDYSSLGIHLLYSQGSGSRFREVNKKIITFANAIFFQRRFCFYKYINNPKNFIKLDSFI